MEYRRLGSSGLKISSVSLGGWLTFGGSVQDSELAVSIIEKAHEHGVNFFDQADVYASGASETMMGAVLKRFDRSKLVISSKVFWPMSDDVNDRGLSRKHVMQSIDASLKRLGTDYLDIYFCHRYDPETPLLETVSAMSDLVRQGKILYWGTSEWSAAQISDAVGVAKAHVLVAPVTEQPQYSLVYRDRVEKEILPATESHGIGLVVWSPLGMGVLSGKYDTEKPAGSRLTDKESFAQRLLSDTNLERVRQFKSVADDLGVTRSTLAIAWVLRQKGVSSAIIGATKPEQLDDTLKASGMNLEPDVVGRIDEIFAPNSSR
jgi:voltage-dependent potassium channel beta subunit